MSKVALTCRVASPLARATHKAQLPSVGASSLMHEILSHCPFDGEQWPHI